MVQFGPFLILMSCCTCLSIAAGVIDQDYRGNVGVVMFNFGKEDFKGMLCHTHTYTQTKLIDQFSHWVRHQKQTFFLAILFASWMPLKIKHLRMTTFLS